MPPLTDKLIARIEQENASGLTSAQILDVCATHGVALSEATLRKYVQLGLLPRSVRVGRKGKHKGSQGVYPVSVVRQIVRIKRMMANDYTIEQIQREFLFVRSEIDQLERTLDSIFAKLQTVSDEKKNESYAKAVAREVADARELAKSLLAQLEAIETKLTSRSGIKGVIAS